jgi:hypothetical protein
MSNNNKTYNTVEEWKAAFTHHCVIKSNFMNFGQALEELKIGARVARRNWNGKGIFIELKVPDEHSKMTSPYIFIDTTGLETENPDAPKSRVPWLASQTDMLAEDWVLVEKQLDI